MKKDIEWLKEQIERLSYTPKGLDESNSIISKNWVLNFIDKVDEPQILSQEWITKNKVERINDVRKMTTSDVVPVEKLKNLLVPKQEITFEQAYDKLREESILSEKSFDYYWNCINDNVEIDEPGNILVPKQDKPVIPQFVAEWIEKQMKFGYEDVFISMTRLRERAPEKVKFWFRNNADTYARAWLDGYEVEKEKLYKVFLPATDRARMAIHDGEVDFLPSFYSGGNYNDTFTESEIKAIDERFWAFAEEVTE